MNLRPEEISAVIKRTDKKLQNRLEISDFGTVIQVGDGIARVYGLENCMAGELLEFTGNTYGMALNLEEDNVGAVILGSDRDIREGDIVKPMGGAVGSTGRREYAGTCSQCAGTADRRKRHYRYEGEPSDRMRSARRFAERKSVNQPLQTGIKAIDSMIPIGRGQRELIIGDRQTGKTAIAIDTILNQRGKNVICVYCAIGQKASTIAKVAQQFRILRRNGLYDRGGGNGIGYGGTAVPCPLRGMSVAEYFMSGGATCWWFMTIFQSMPSHTERCRCC